MQTMSGHIHHIEESWLSEGNCHNRIMQLSDALNDFLGSKPEMKHMLTSYEKAFVDYLVDIVEKLNMLNEQPYRYNKALFNAKTSFHL